MQGFLIVQSTMNLLGIGDHRLATGPEKLRSKFLPLIY